MRNYDIQLGDVVRFQHVEDEDDVKEEVEKSYSYREEEFNIFKLFVLSVVGNIKKKKHIVEMPSSW